jgi:hypothetical protein
VWRAGLLLVAVLAATARADDPAGTDLDAQRDAFGFKSKRPAQQEPLDCNDGTQFGCVGATTDPLDEHANPYALSTWLPASYLLRLPVGDASHDAVAHYGLGASRDEAGPFFAGATGLENRWTLHGAPIDDPRTGGAGTRIPLAFLDGIFVGAGGFTARDRVSTGGLIDAHLRGGPTNYRTDVYTWSGYTGRSRQRPIAPFSYQVRRGELDTGREASIHAVVTGRLPEWLIVIPGSEPWYAAGIGAEVTSLKLTWTAGTTRDRDQDGMTDGLPGVVPLDQIDQYSRRPITWRVPFMLRAGYRSRRHGLDATIVGHAGTDVFHLYNSTLQASGTRGLAVTGDAIVTYRGTWSARTRARAQLAWHRATRTESAVDDAAANEPQLLSAYVPATLDDDPNVAAACNDTSPDDPYPLITNCPVPSGWFASGGAGQLDDTTVDRPSISADIAHRIGNNVLRAGATGEDTRFVLESRFTGRYEVRSLFPEHRSERRFVDRDAVCNGDVTLPCPTTATSELRYRTRYTAAYVEDTWQASKSIAVNAGMRWELMWVGPVLHFSDQLAPRLGASWDPLGGGRSRMWASMGRSFAMLPAGLGGLILERHRTVDEVSSPFGPGRSVDTGAVVNVADGVEPIAQDELTSGAQIALARTVRATVWVQGRWLRRGLDDTTTGFDNPGRVSGTPATRETGLFAAEIATAPTAKLVLRAGYMYGRTIGSWTGAFDPRQGAVLYGGEDFDTTSVNLLGRLPTDIGHRTYVEAERRGHLSDIDVGLAIRLTAGSGRPRNALGESDDGTIYLIPRGSAGRAPVMTQANVRMSARWGGLDITLDVFNMFNRREATTVEEFYARGASVRPIDHGTREDLIWLKTESGGESSRNRTYSHATAYQTPRSAVLGIHQAF